jgi:PAS domain S-box-containing protein
VEQRPDFLRQVIDITPHFLFVKDREGRFTLVNQAVADAYGTTVEDLIGKTDADFNPNADQVESFRRDDLEVMDTLQEKFIPEEAITDANGRTRYLQTIKRPLVDEDGVARRVLGVATDITALREANEERSQLEAQVQHAQKLESLGILAGGIAHDFNNLLAGILSNLDVLRRRVPGAAEDKAMDLARSASERAAELCAQMLAYSGRGHFQLEAVDLNPAVRAMEELLGTSVTTAEIEYDLAERLPTIDADPSQVKQIVMNLVINASEALDDKPGTIRVATRSATVEDGEVLDGITMDALPAGEYVVLEVEDDGPGMTPEAAMKAFEPFYSTKGAGRGLGLAAVLGIVRGHRGAIRVDPRPGGGARFRVWIPVGSLPRRSEPPGAELPSSSVAPSRVLVVDDEPIVREAIREVLELEGVEVLVARDGEEALEILRAEADWITGVLLDLSMPRRSGDEVLREIRTCHRDLPVVLMSGFDQAESANSLRDVSANGFLKKPFDAESLLSVVHTMNRRAG